MTRLVPKLVPSGLAIVAAGMLWFWLGRDWPGEFRLREPGAAAAASQAASAPVVDIRGQFVAGDGQPAQGIDAAWPRFRGPRGDAVSQESAPLATSFPPDGPKPLWSVNLGEGYAGPAVLNGRVYLLDYDQTLRADALRCLSLADGREIWRRSYLVSVSRQHGMSRTVPAVTDEHVVTLGPLCQVMCCDAKTGDFRWGIDLVRQYGATVPPWYAGQCPLIDNGRAILAPGGKALMLAVDCRAGQVVWEVPNPRGWKMTHSSILLTKLGGTRMYVYCASGGVIGVSAEDGKLLWEFPQWTVGMANVPAPVDCGGGRIFLSGGYGSGSMMIQLVDEGGQIKVKPLFRLKESEFGSEQQTPIYYQDHLYGVMTKDAGGLKEQLVCLDLEGKRLWASGRENLFGPFGGPYLAAQDMLYLVSDAGVLTLVEASPQGYRQLGRWKVLANGECWAPLALAGGRLLVRDLKKMVCLDVRRPE